MTTPLRILLCFLLLPGYAGAQLLIPFEFYSEEENRFLKETDSFKCYVSGGDTTQTVCLNEDAGYYKLLNKGQKVLAEGSYIVEGEKYLQTGKWRELFDNGNMKITGAYQRNKPIGTWQEYYLNGKVKAIYNFTIVVNEEGVINYCLSGSWQEFYPNGKPKVIGYYTMNEKRARDTVTVEDPITEQKVIKTVARLRYLPAKTGVWEYYSENGELDKQENF
jgi:antitoxin component YwqK of YwqJK toxin-antitoxin module